MGNFFSSSPKNFLESTRILFFDLGVCRRKSEVSWSFLVRLGEMSELTLYFDYSEQSHVLTGKPSDEVREKIKTLKIGNYHPRLYPKDQTPLKGWLIRKEKMEDLEQIFDDHNIDVETEQSNLIANVVVDLVEFPYHKVFQATDRKHPTGFGLSVTVGRSPYVVGFTWHYTHVKPDRHPWFVGLDERSPETDLERLKDFFDYFLSLCGPNIRRYKRSAEEVIKLFFERGVPENLPPVFYKYFSKPDKVFQDMPSVIREVRKDVDEVGPLTDQPTEVVPPLPVTV